MQTLLESRLYSLAYAEPSNFTKHCRQYLGETYFETLEDAEDSEDE